MTIAVCAVLSGAGTWVDVAACGRSKVDWFRTFLALPHGIPSHDTFGRAFAALDPAAFEAGFVTWVHRQVHAAPATIAIDGKSVWGSHDQAADLGPLHLVSARATDQRPVLGQIATAEKSNEITVIPLLLAALDLHGTVVTIDAIGCQREIAVQIRAAGGDYVLAIKENQPELFDLITDHVALVAAGRADQPASSRAVEKNHGRLEIRTCQVTDDPALNAWLDPTGRWMDLRSMVAVTGERRCADGDRVATRYYLSSLAADALRVADAVRDHLALTLLQRDDTVKAGFHAKRLKAGWDTNYLHHLLAD